MNHRNLYAALVGINAYEKANSLNDEAFTAGAYLEDGTELELDLNQQAGFPESFYYQYQADNPSNTI